MLKKCGEVLQKNDQINTNKVKNGQKSVFETLNFDFSSFVFFDIFVISLFFCVFSMAL